MKRHRNIVLLNIIQVEKRIVILSKRLFKIDGSNVNILEREQLEEIKDIVSNNIEDEKADCNKPKIIRLVNTEQAKEELL